MPCLIPCAIDQDPYFRQCREHAQRLGYLKPAIIHAVFLPSLKGREMKMSASDADSSVFLSDTDKQIRKKIANSFSGGQDTREKHRELGGRTEVDIPFQYLRFFLEDDEELERIRVAYEKGEMESGEIKKRCADEVIEYVAAFRERRTKVTAAIRDEYLRPRRLEFTGCPADTVYLNAKLDGYFDDMSKDLQRGDLKLEDLEKRFAQMKASASS